MNGCEKREALFDWTKMKCNVYKGSTPGNNKIMINKPIYSKS